MFLYEFLVSYLSKHPAITLDILSESRVQKALKYPSQVLVVSKLEKKTTYNESSKMVYIQ